MSKVFVTGATGFIGGKLVEKLLAKGYEVKVLIRDEDLLKYYKWKDEVDIVIGDILTPETFNGKMDDCEIIIHSAATIAFWNKLWDRVYETNVVGTKNIVTEAKKVNPKKFIHISSVAAIGISEDGTPINEDHPYNWGPHKICYMETKHQAEEEVKKGIEKGLKATFVNPANVWGAGDHRGRRAFVVKAIKYGVPFYVNAATNFVDVDAVCEATINAIDLGKVGERYILGGENLTIKEFSKIIADEVGAGGPKILVPKLFVVIYCFFQEILGTLFNITPRPTMSQLSLFGPKVYYDSSKAIKELNMPVIPVKDCIKKTIDFYKEESLI